MSWRNLVIVNPARLNYQNGQFVCQKAGEAPLSVPLEDIASITLETPQATITSALLGACAKMGIVLITCDSYHLPNGALLPLAHHSRPLLVLKRQIGWSAPLKKRLWQSIVQRKIENQCEVLAQFNQETADLKTLAARTRSGDPDNREAQAARVYFSRLFTNFKRHANDKTNAAMNYGYAIVRACVARELAKFGFHPAIGIYHCNELNAFNLADDLLEPFRPAVDIWTVSALNLADDKPLSVEERATLTQVLQLGCVIGEKEQRLLHAIHLSVKSLSTVSRNNEASHLLLPQWVGGATIKSMQ